MIVARKYPTSLDELIEFVLKAANGAECVAMQAGHFLVYYDHTEDQLLPCIATELTGPRHEPIRDQVGQFPLLTWELGLKLLAALPARKKHILVLVNDWQYLPPGVDRARFYEKHNRLPKPYRDALAKTHHGISMLSPPPVRKGLSTGEFFSEQTLRNQYRKHIKQLIDCKALPQNAEILASGDGLTCSLVDAVGQKQEIYCTGKSENCTHEVAELVSAVREHTQCDAFLNIFPAVCQEYVEAGTDLAHELFSCSTTSVVNIGIPASSLADYADLFIGCSATLHTHNKV